MALLPEKPRTYRRKDEDGQALSLSDVVRNLLTAPQPRRLRQPVAEEAEAEEVPQAPEWDPAWMWGRQPSAPTTGTPVEREEEE